MDVSSPKEISLNKYFKIIFLGSSRVGKTSLIRRILGLELLAEYSATVGVRYHNLEVEKDEKNKLYLQLWDVSGNEIYSEILTPVLKQASIIVLMFDYSDNSSQSTLLELYNQVCESVSPTQILLVGSKSETTKDLIPKKMSSWIKEHNLTIYPVSNRENTGKSLLLQIILQNLTNIQNGGNTLTAKTPMGSTNSK